MDQILIRFASEEAAPKSGIAVLGINPMALLLQLTTFVILILILKKFAFGPISKALEQRQTTIEKGVDLGLEMETEKQKLAEEVEKILHKARADADEVLHDTHIEAGSILKEAEAAAERKVAAMLMDAQGKMEKDIVNAKKAIEKETLELVARATEVIITEKLDAKKDASLIQRALRSIR